MIGSINNDADHSAQRMKTIAAAFENWWDKYKVTLAGIEGKRDVAAKALQGLGYV